MKKTILIIALFVLFAPQQSFAEQGSEEVTTQETTSKKELKKDQVMERKADLMEKKEARVEALQTKKEARSEAISQKKAALKEKLQAFKDQQKAGQAEIIDAKLDDINKNRTDWMSERIAKLSEILSKLEAKKIEAQTNGKDVSSVNAAIVAAEAAIATAEAAITAQAAKDYTPQVTSETTLKQNFGTVMSQLRSDLLVTHKTVKDAKGAVKAAAKALKLVEGETAVSITPVVSTSPAI